MAKMKKIIGLVVALTMVFTMAICSTSASAAFLGMELGDGKLGWMDLSKLNPLNWDLDLDDEEDVATEDEVIVEEEEEEEFKPFIDFYIDYDVVKTLNWGFSIGDVPEEEPVEDVTEPVEETTEEVVEIVEATPEVDETTEAPEVIVDETPLADVEEIANTGDAGVATIVALSAVSAAAFVVAKKK